METIDLATLRSLVLTVREDDSIVGSDLDVLVLTMPKRGYLTCSTDYTIPRSCRPVVDTRSRQHRLLAIRGQRRSDEFAGTAPRASSAERVEHYEERRTGGRAVAGRQPGRWCATSAVYVAHPFDASTTRLEPGAGLIPRDH
ncbi:MAG: hypothetical protein WBE26_13300 [Phycisphaerae bacterium]